MRHQAWPNDPNTEVQERFSFRVTSRKEGCEQILSSWSEAQQGSHVAAPRLKLSLDSRIEGQQVRIWRDPTGLQSAEARRSRYIRNDSFLLSAFDSRHSTFSRYLTLRLWRYRAALGQTWKVCKVTAGLGLIGPENAVLPAPKWASECAAFRRTRDGVGLENPKTRATCGARREQ
jgi:hypothetical protein